MSRVAMLAAVAVAGLLAGCRGNSGPPAPAAMTVYAINYMEIKTGEHSDAFFHGYGIFGQADVAEEEDRRKIIATLEQSLDDEKTEAVEGFQPRHAIRFESGGQVREYLLCFTCNQYVAFTDGVAGKPGRLSSKLEIHLNRQLSKNNISLVP